MTNSCRVALICRSLVSGVSGVLALTHGMCGCEEAVALHEAA